MLRRVIRLMIAQTVLASTLCPSRLRVCRLQIAVCAPLDNTARLWDAGSGQPRADLRVHQDRVTAAVFSPDGQRVVTASLDGTARLWRVFATTQELIEYARSIVPRQLTPDQRWRFFLEERAPEDEPAIAPRAVPTPASPPVAAGPPE